MPERWPSPCLYQAEMSFQLTGRNMGYEYYDYSIADKELIKRISNSNTDAFECLFHRYMKYLHNVAFNRLRSGAVADDLVQEVFTEIWLRRQELSIQTTVKTYLHQAIKYQVYNYIRHASVREKEMHIQRIHDEYYQRNPNTAETLAVAELQGQVDHHLQNLPEKTQHIFHLSRREHFSHKEIAEKLNCSTKTVEYHIGKVLSHLRMNLTEYFTFTLGGSVSLWIWMHRMM